MNTAAIRSIAPESYVAHELHTGARSWTESNCYVDVWIELLHALGCEPLACLPFVLGIDWEGDQFTFLKPPSSDLTELYGVEVQELNVYRPLLHSATEQLSSGRLVLTEADSFFLPDTAGTDYGSQHTKTTIAIQEIDPDARTLGYFHNASYHALAGEDFAGLFRLGAPADPAYMPPFAERVRTTRLVRLRPAALTARSVALMRGHLATLPAVSPVARFAAKLEADMRRIREDGLAAYHAYAFATLRQLGAAFELAALYLGWLTIHGEARLEECTAAFRTISDTSKALLMKLARSVSARREVDGLPMLAEVDRHWRSGTTALARRYGVP